MRNFILEREYRILKKNLNKKPNLLMSRIFFKAIDFFNGAGPRYELNSNEKLGCLLSQINLNCLFIHIPKTAGTSLVESLFGNSGCGHKTFQDYIRILEPKFIDKLFKFTFIREPISRYLSSYNYLLAGGNNVKDKYFCNKILKKYSDINHFTENWLNKRNIYSQIHFVPQVDFVNGCNQLKLDKLYLLEDIEHSFDDIKKRLKIDRKLLHINKTSDIDRISVVDLTPNTLDKIKEIYKSDFLLYSKVKKL